MLTKALAILALLLALTAGWFAYLANDRARQLDTAAAVHTLDQQTIGSYTSANTTNHATIATLLTKLDQAVGVAQAVQSAANAASALAATNADARDKALAKARRLQGELYANDQASSDWAAGHLSDALTAGLRDTWLAASDNGARDAGGGCSPYAVCGDPGQSDGTPRLGAFATAGIPCAAGCYTNAQLRSLLDDALDSRGRCLDQLDAIAQLSKFAVTTTTPP